MVLPSAEIASALLRGRPGSDPSAWITPSSQYTAAVPTLV
jgi:hypothetical protein